MDDNRGAILIGLLVVLVCVIGLILSGILPVNLTKLTGDQIGLAAIVFVAFVGIGWAIKLILDNQDSVFEISTGEFVVGVLILGPILAILSVNIGWNIAYHSNITFNENRNGWELATVAQTTQCSEDGPCAHEYSCDLYYVVVIDYDSKGNISGSHLEPRWRSCPYATEEMTYVIQTTLGDFVIDNHVFSSSPVEWRAGSGIPGEVQRGPSEFWSAAKGRCDSGHPGPVTQRNTYENYLLASDQTILRQYSAQIISFKKAGVLPDFNHTDHDLYYMDRVYFVGYKPANTAMWEATMSYFDSALGNELHGDIHLVIVQNDYVSGEPEAYINALKAYWSDPKIWGKDALSKNGIIVVVGTKDGQTVSWARATTGMPVGNNEMIVAIQNHMQGIALTPGSVIGLVDTSFYTKTKSDGTTKVDVKSVGTDGFLRQVIWGQMDPSTKYCRISMSGNSDCGSGFTYLASEIKPTTDQQIWIVIIAILVSCLVWCVDAFFIGERENRLY